MASVQELFAEVHGDLRPVADLTHSWVCPGCLGPKGDPYRWCPACGRLRGAGVPEALLRSTVPISVARRPGPWYNRLATYKAGHPEYRAHLVSVLWTYFETHLDDIEGLLGGEVSMIAVVPSKRGRTYEQQPLRKALAMVGPIRELLAPVLAYHPDEEVTELRSSYYPQCFDQEGESPDGERVLLVEDTWVTGATALSTAGKLQALGAAGVLIMPVARVIDTDFWAQMSSPYLQWMEGESVLPFDPSRWPR